MIMRMAASLATVKKFWNLAASFTEKPFTKAMRVRQQVAAQQ